MPDAVFCASLKCVSSQLLSCFPSLFCYRCNRCMGDRASDEGAKKQRFPPARTQPQTRWSVRAIRRRTAVRSDVFLFRAYLAQHRSAISKLGSQRCPPCCRSLARDRQRSRVGQRKALTCGLITSSYRPCTACKAFPREQPSTVDARRLPRAVLAQFSIPTSTIATQWRMRLQTATD